MDLPKVAQNKPFVLKVEAGRYAWCSCGLSENQPYCDGKHKGTGYTPNIEVIEEARKVAFCGCKQSEKGSFCDGAHAKL